jgi:tetratricopeptide (TPR) repeat protein
MAKAAAPSPKSSKKSAPAEHAHDHDHDHDHDHGDHDHDHDDKPAAKKSAKSEGDATKALERLSAAGRNDPCPCGSGKKYKKCHLAADEQATIAPPEAPDAKELLTNGWRLFEQRRPGAAEKEFRAALAVDATLQDAHVGIGMARLSAGNSDGAKEELSGVIAAGEGEIAKLRTKGTKDAFSQTEYQPYIRAAHALGCLAYDEERFADAVTDLERVHGVDDGSVGVEARLIAAKALMKLEKPADAVALLEPAAKLEGGAGRANLGLALAHFATGAEAPAKKALAAALATNPHYGKTLLGRIRRRVDNVAGAQPGSIEEALLYAQTYGDVWNDAAKKFLEKTLDEKVPAPAAESAAESP